tara:strand:- start:1849 stop:2193 length:345 start_codon:yes stop_codon:yes gene_type:complete
MFKPFKSITEIKEKGEFHRRGKILPSRILKCSNKKEAHRVVTGSDQWAFPTNKGYILFVENNNNFSFLLKVSSLNLCLEGSPYSKGGTHWVGNFQLSDEEALNIFNKHYLEKVS